MPAEALEAFRDAGGAVNPMLLGGCETAAGNAGPGPASVEHPSGRAGGGHLPPVTAEQTWACFGQVGPWLARARQCQADPAYDPGGELTLPSAPVRGRRSGWWSGRCTSAGSG